MYGKSPVHFAGEIHKTALKKALQPAGKTFENASVEKSLNLKN
jgi:hypothetical protein